MQIKVWKLAANWAEQSPTHSLSAMLCLAKAGLNVDVQCVLDNKMNCKRVSSRMIVGKTNEVLSLGRVFSFKGQSKPTAIPAERNLRGVSSIRYIDYNPTEYHEAANLTLGLADVWDDYRWPVARL